nr:hypothetical protein CR513_35146 [Ipomoea batatas]
MLAGISPESLLCATLSCSSFLSFPMDSGRLPTRLLKLTSNTFSSFRSPISSGKHAPKLTFIRIISLRVFRILAMLGGRHPRRLLFAKTRTETGEFPKFLGNVTVKLLWFTKRASSFRAYLLGNLSLVLIVPDVQELERRERKNDGGELAAEEVIADVELEEEAEVGEAPGESSGEPVGVYMEKRQVGEEAEVLRQCAGNICVV